MTENWAQVQSEIATAIKSVAGVSDSGGYPATLRRVTVTGGDPYDPGAGTETITYTTIHVIDTNKQIRDASGTLVKQTQRTLLVAAEGTVPLKSDKVFVGEAKTYVDEATDADIAWMEVDEVRPLSPLGTDLLFKLDLAN